MANPDKRLRDNVEGDFFVDSTCIDCDTCRQLAPATFVEQGEYSVVFQQPASRHEEFAAYQAMLACPVGSIGTMRNKPALFGEARQSFPMVIEDGVFYMGFNSEKSFGANSYFIRHPEGNWMIDSPRYLPQLVKFIHAQGGLRYLFLSHEDDVAEAARYAPVFGATRIIHRSDLHAMPEAEWVIEGTKPIQMATDVIGIPVPGHTPGSMALCYRDRFLFTGDHVWWDPNRRELGTPKNLVWNDRQLHQSVRTLLKYRFEWVLPGHGHRVHLPRHAMYRALERLITRRCGSPPAE